MKGMKKALPFGLAAIFAFGVLGYLLFGSSPPMTDMGGRSGPTEIKGRIPRVKDDPLAPVGNIEASRRATINVDKAEASAEQVHVSPPVINQKVDLGLKPLQEAEIPKGQSLPAVRDASGVSLPSVQPPQIIYTQAQPQINVQASQQTVTEQITAVLDTRSRVGMISFKTPAAREPVQSVPINPANSGTNTANAINIARHMVLPPGYQSVIAAKPGDVFSASLDLGFNSDDPRGLPIFATIYDYRLNGQPGPLHGARLMGNITYAQEQASVTFTQMTLADGRTAQTKAMAVSASTMRAGVATDVDRHLLERYGALFATSLLQGIGQAGQTLIGNNRSTYYDPVTGLYSTAAQGVNWGQVAMATVQPIGQNLTSALGNNFNRPPTISASALQDVGIVFLQPVTVPMSMMNTATR